MTVKLYDEIKSFLKLWNWNDDESIAINFYIKLAISQNISHIPLKFLGKEEHNNLNLIFYRRKYKVNFAK